MAGGGGGSRGGKRKRPSGRTAFRPKGKKPAKDKEMFKRRKYARNNYVLENKVRPAQLVATECYYFIWSGNVEIRIRKTNPLAW
jgi:hypothetical protein